MIGARDVSQCLGRLGLLGVDVEEERGEVRGLEERLLLREQRSAEQIARLVSVLNLMAAEKWGRK